MAEPRVITSYLEALSERLPAEIVDELADGLAETHRAYLRRGLDPGPAAEAATAEFGEPALVVDCLTGSPRAAGDPGCRQGRRLTPMAGRADAAMSRRPAQT